MNALVELCLKNQYATDKFSGDHANRHRYVEGFYGETFDPIRESVTKVLEIGVWEGASLFMWRDYFSNAQIIGLDVDPRLRPANYANDRIEIIVGNAYRKATVDQFENSSFDIIIDDGSHNVSDQIFVIDEYLSKVKKGGWLIIEDLWPNSVQEVLAAAPKNAVYLDSEVKGQPWHQDLTRMVAMQPGKRKRKTKVIPITTKPKLCVACDGGVIGPNSHCNKCGGLWVNANLSRLVAIQK